MQFSYDYVFGYCNIKLGCFEFFANERATPYEFLSMLSSVNNKTTQHTFLNLFPFLFIF